MLQRALRALIIRNVQASCIMCGRLLSLWSLRCFLSRLVSNIQGPQCSNFEEPLKSSIKVVRSAPILAKMFLSIEASRDNYRVTDVFWALICSPYARLQVDDPISLGTHQRLSSYAFIKGAC